MFHKFPRDATLCNKWNRANPGKEFVPTKHSRICSLHFRESDFVEQHQDSNPRRRKKFASTALLKCRYLKKDAVPSIFPNAPSYLSTSTTATQPRASAAAATSSCRLKDAEHLDLLYETFQMNDD